MMATMILQISLMESCQYLAEYGWATWWNSWRKQDGRAEDGGMLTYDAVKGILTDCNVLREVDSTWVVLFVWYCD